MHPLKVLEEVIDHALVEPASRVGHLVVSCRQRGTDGGAAV